MNRISAALMFVLPLLSFAAEPPKGQRVFMAGHSFHMPVAPFLNDIAKVAGVKDHQLVGTQPLGGSRTIAIWNIADDKNRAKQSLRDGKVDVLTLSPHLKLPDEGIDHFTALALEHNKDVRIFAQASWYLYDLPGKNNGNFKNPERDDVKIADLRKGYETFYKELSDQVKTLNEKVKRPVVFLAPVGHAVINLREQVVAGKVPGIAKQSELFTDSIGHARSPVLALAAYVHFAMIYRQSPVGLPVPDALKKAVKPEEAEKLNRVLQEIAWETVTKEPNSGVK